MNNIPYTSYIFIGITSLVLTYATIADTEKEIMIEPEASVETVEASEASVETVEASASAVEASAVEAVPETSTLKPAEGGKKRKTKKHRKKEKRSNKSKKK
jgi:hypothetical protein